MIDAEHIAAIKHVLPQCPWPNLLHCTPFVVMTLLLLVSYAARQDAVSSFVAIVCATPDQYAYKERRCRSDASALLSCGTSGVGVITIRCRVCSMKSTARLCSCYSYIQDCKIVYPSSYAVISMSQIMLRNSTPLGTGLQSIGMRRHHQL